MVLFKKIRFGKLQGSFSTFSHLKEATFDWNTMYLALDRLDLESTHGSESSTILYKYYPLTNKGQSNIRR